MLFPLLDGMLDALESTTERPGKKLHLSFMSKNSHRFVLIDVNLNKLNLYNLSWHLNVLFLRYVVGLFLDLRKR